MRRELFCISYMHPKTALRNVAFRTAVSPVLGTTYYLELGSVCPKNGTAVLQKGYNLMSNPMAYSISRSFSKYTMVDIVKARDVMVYVG